jgi:hypothetical protein
MPRVGFEPITPVFERAKAIHALEPRGHCDRLVPDSTYIKFSTHHQRHMTYSVDRTSANNLWLIVTTKWNWRVVSVRPLDVASWQVYTFLLYHGCCNDVTRLNQASRPQHRNTYKMLTLVCSVRSI